MWERYNVAASVKYENNFAGNPARVYYVGDRAVRERVWRYSYRRYRAREVCRAASAEPD